MNQQSFKNLTENKAKIDAVNARINKRNIYMKVICKLLNKPYVKMEHVK